MGTIAEDKKINNTHILRSQDQTMVVRGNYSYTIALMNDNRGVLAKVISKAGERLNRGDEVIFMDVNQVRKAYRFIEAPRTNRSSDTPVYENILQLDMAAIQWFSSTAIGTLYLKNNTSNQMRKLTVAGGRQAEFKQKAVCFTQRLDPNLVKDVKVDADLPTPAAGKPISATSSLQKPKVRV
ncbi:MAG: hypothetical protein AAF738_10345, partial [Bacteroidota bacterium]